MGPYVKSNVGTKKIMNNLLLSLIPLVIFAVYKNGFIPFINNKIDFLGMVFLILFIIIGSFTSFLVEFIYYRFIKKTDFWKNSYAIFPGLFLSLILPFKTPIYILIIGSVVASLSKILLGGFGKNKLNPALVGYLFIVIFFSNIFTTNNYFSVYELDTINSPTPLTNASMLSDIGSYKELVKPYGNMFDFFIGTIPGSFAETSALICLISFIFLSVTKTIKWRIPLTYIVTVFVITFGIGRLLGQGFYYPLFHIFSGGLMFGAIFMATDPVTSAMTPLGQILQGLILGILTVIFRFTGVEGVAFSILIMNIFTFLLDKIGLVARFNFMKSLPYFVVVCLVIIVTIFSLASMKRVVDNKDPNFAILSKEEKDNKTSYIVTQKGYGGKIKASVVFEADRIVAFEVLSNNETKDRYQLIVDNDYLNLLVQQQDNIDSVDTISTATVTSNSLKKLLLNVIEDYN